jgi:hypothetical protein
MTNTGGGDRISFCSTDFNAPMLCLIRDPHPQQSESAHGREGAARRCLCHVRAAHLRHCPGHGQSQRQHSSVEWRGHTRRSGSKQGSDHTHGAPAHRLDGRALAATYYLHRGRRRRTHKRAQIRRASLYVSAEAGITAGSHGQHRQSCTHQRGVCLGTPQPSRRRRVDSAVAPGAGADLHTDRGSGDR